MNNLMKRELLRMFLAFQIFPAIFFLLAIVPYLAGVVLFPAFLSTLTLANFFFLCGLPFELYLLYDYKLELMKYGVDISAVL